MEAVLAQRQPARSLRDCVPKMEHVNGSPGVYQEVISVRVGSEMADRDTYSDYPMLVKLNLASLAEVR